MRPPLLPPRPLPILLVLSLAIGTGCGAPTIKSFGSSATSVSVGQAVILSWEATGASSFSVAGVELDGNTRSVSVTPTETTTYVLTAKGWFGAATSDPVTVTLVPRFELAVGTYGAGRVGTTVAILLRDTAGALLSADTSVTISPPFAATPDTPFTITCPGGKPLCLAAFPSLPATTGTYSARTTVAGTELTASSVMDADRGLASARPVLASKTGPSAIQASWSGVPGAVSYRAQPINLSQAGAPAGDARILTGTSAVLTTSAPLAATDLYAVAVEASALDLTLSTAPRDLPAPDISRTIGQLDGSPGGWQLLPPSSWSGSSLQVSFNNLDISERLAVILMNIDGPDGSSSNPGVPAQLAVSGMLPLSAGAPAPATLATPEVGLWMDPAAHQLEREEEAEIARLLREGHAPAASIKPVPGALVPAAAPVNTSFCVRIGTGTQYTRRSATLKRESAHALFYVDDADASQYTSHEPGIWDSLQSSWENKVYPSDTATFGAESDVDGNQKLIVLLSSQLGASSNSTILLGYYSAADVYFDKDATAGCTGTKSNWADMFYLNSIGNLTAGGAYTTSEVIDRLYPDTLAHEFQHLINFNQHVYVHGAVDVEETWINEGLSMVAEELAGFGWNTSGARANGARYLDRDTSTPNIESYNRRSLTKWEGDPIGNYEAAHAFFRYCADRLGSATLGQLVQTRLIGRANVESALGLSFDRAYANWTTALLLSNEGLLPGPHFDFTGAAWTPLHTRLRHLNYEPLPPTGATARLRTDGWNAFVTGSASGSSATVTITSAQPVKPHVLVVRFSGSLPN